MGAFSNPIIINSEGTSQKLDRISLNSDSGSFSEEWLQKAIFKSPDCLPINEIAPSFGALVPIAMELETGSGPADILCVTDSGQIVIIETKLWRNPEARRVVVAQILDYAKSISAWNYNDLARQVSIATKKGPNYLLECVQKHCHGLSESEFVDGINHSLKKGDFLLLIIGDGIRTGTESLVGFLEQFGSLRFTFGLIEVAAFSLPDGNTLLHPRVLAKTEILERTVLVNAGGSIEVEELAEVEELESQTNPQHDWYRQFWQEFLEQLKLDDKDQPLPKALPKSTNMYFPMPPRSDLAWISAYLGKSQNVAGVYLTFARNFENVDEYFEELQGSRADIEREFGADLNWDKEGRKVYIMPPKINYTDLNNPEERDRVIRYLTDTLRRMVNVFRFRLEQLAQEQ